MQTLHDDLEKLRKLNELRTGVKALRDAGYRSLNGVRRVTETTNRIMPTRVYKRWHAMGNVLEAAAILKVKRHWRLARIESPEQGSVEFFQERVLTGEVSASLDPHLDVPVLIAAMRMELLSERSSTVLSKENLLCYYRILVEMRLATWPDWTVGAARAGEGARDGVQNR